MAAVDRFSGELSSGKPFHASAYLRVLRRTGKQQTFDSIKESLTGLLCADDNKNLIPGTDLGVAWERRAGGGTPQSPGESVEQRGAWMWTAPHVFHRLNQAVCDDDEEQLQTYMPLIRAMNGYLVPNGPKQTISTFRGSITMPTKYCENCMYRFGMFVASSTREDKAASFYKMYNKKSILEFRIPAGCLNAGYLEPITYYKTEEEYLLPPYTAVTCRRIGTRRFKMPDGRMEEVPWALFDVVRDNLEAEAEFERYANLYVATNYYQLMEAAKSYPNPQIEDVVGSIKHFNDHAVVDEGLNIFRRRGENIRCAEDFAAYMYTVDEPRVYRQVALALIADRYGELEHWVPFLRAFEGFFRANVLPEQTIVYRAEEMADPEHFNLVGELAILSTKVMSTSRNRSLVENFLKPSATLFEIIVPRRCPRAADLGRVSMFTAEEEVTIAPYSIARVKAARPGFIRYEILETTKPGADILKALHCQRA